MITTMSPYARLISQQEDENKPNAPQTMVKSVPGPTQYNIGKMPKEDLHKYVDSIMDKYDNLEMELRQQRDEMSTRGLVDKADYENVHDIDSTLEQINRSRELILNNNAHWYKRASGPASTTSPGAEDTTDSVWTHPAHIIARGWLGTKEFASLPFRAAESLTGKEDEKGGGGYWPESYSFKKMIEKHREQLDAADRAKNIDPNAIGTQIAEVLGPLPIPIGPSVKAGQILKNIAKGAGFGSGIYASERVARDEPWDAAGLTGSATAGGVLAGVLGALLGRGKGAVGARSAGPEPSTHPETGPKPTPTGPAEGAPGTGKPFDINVPPKPGPGSPIEPGFIGKLKVLKPTPKQGAEAATPTRPAITERPPEGEVPNVTPVPTRTLADVVGIKPPQPAPETVVAKEAPRPEAVTPVLREKAIEQTKKMSGKSKLLTPEEALAMAKEVDTAKTAMEGEATLKGVISGKIDVNKLPQKSMTKARGVKGGKKQEVPKSEAPVPAVEGEAGANSKIAPATFKAVQEGHGHFPDYELYDLTADIPGHPKGSTVSGDTLKEAGYTIPAKIAPPGAVKFFGEPEAKSQGDWFERTLQAQKASRAPVEDVASAKITKSQAELPAQEVPHEAHTKTTKLELQPKRTEDFIREQGYQVKEREPFPGQREYDIVDPRTGKLIARGDREQLTYALGQRKEAKGFKLYSFPGPLDEFADWVKNKVNIASGRLPEGVTVEKSPLGKSSLTNTLLRPLETPEFAMRGAGRVYSADDVSKMGLKPEMAGQRAGDIPINAGREANRGIEKRYNDLLYKELPGNRYEPTGYHAYASMPKDERDLVDKIMVLGDKEGVTYSAEQLARQGVTPKQIVAYQGVHEALDKAAKWVEELGGKLEDFTERKLPGYLPRVFPGQWEIFTASGKYLKPKDSASTFRTYNEALEEVYKIKAKDPTAKLSMRFWPDVDYAAERGMMDARAIARLKNHLTEMGYTDHSMIDEAFGMGKTLKGFAKHLEKRRGETGYQTTDLDAVLSGYFHEAARRVEMRKVKDVADKILKDHTNDLSVMQMNYLRNFVERVGGKPAWDDIALHNLVQETAIGKWIDPIGGGRLIKKANELTTHLMLGFGNVGWASLQLSSIPTHTWPLLQEEAIRLGSKNPLAAERYLGSAIKQFFTDKGIRQMLAHHGVVDIQLMSEPHPVAGHSIQGAWTPAKVSLLLGTLTDEFTRSVTAIARFNMAKDFGASTEQALAAAAKFVEITQGHYTVGGKPMAFTGSIGGTMGRFKTYPVVMLQNGWRAFGSLHPGVITRYIAGTVGVGGVLGLMPGVEDMDEFITKHWGWSPIEMAEKNLPPAVTYGLGSLVGLDFSRRAGNPDIIPNNWKGMTGPLPGKVIQIMTDVMNGEWGDMAMDLLPNSLRNIAQSARGWNEGKIIGRKDKPTYEASRKEAVEHALGLPSMEETGTSRLYQRNLNKMAYRESELDSLTRRIVAERASDKDYQKFRELGGRNQRIKNERRRQQETITQSQYRHLPKMLRREQEAP